MPDCTQTSGVPTTVSDFEPGPILGVLLAGGQARRMNGIDKPLLLLGGQPLLAHAMARLHSQTSSLVISANGPPQRFARFALPVLADTVPGQPGPLAGILAGMLWAREVMPEITHIISLPGDTPFPPPDLVARLVAAQKASGQPVVRATSAGRRHHAVALWPIALAEQLAGALEQGMRKVGRFAEHCGVAEADFAAIPFDPFLNVNTPEDLAEAERILPFARSASL